MNRAARSLLVVLISPLLAQQAPFFPVKPSQIFPSLSYGLDAWSLLRIRNPSTVAKSALVAVYRADGEPLQPERIIPLAPRQSTDIRIEEPAADYEVCWASVVDVSKNKSGEPLQADARVERVAGNKLEDFPQSASLPDRTGHWMSPADGVSNQRLFFLNLSDSPTNLEICSVNFGPTCSAAGARATSATVKGKQSIVLNIGVLKRRGLLIRSVPVVPSIIGLLQPSIPTTREYSSESSITFDESPGK